MPCEWSVSSNNVAVTEALFRDEKGGGHKLKQKNKIITTTTTIKKFAAAKVRYDNVL